MEQMAQDVQDEGTSLITTYEMQPTLLYSPDEVERLVVLLGVVNPGKTRAYYLNHIYKYDRVVYAAVQQSRVQGRNFNITYPQVLVSYMSLRDQLGRYGCRTKQHYWWDLFQTHSPLLKKVSSVKSGYSYIGGRSMDTIAELTVAQSVRTSTQQFFREINAKDLWHTPIDLQSLQAYITKTLMRDLPDAERDLESDPSLGNRNHRDQIQYNLNYALAIQAIAEENGGQLPQQKRLSPFGRMYFSGINLQTAPRRVRHAALGTCWNLDIESAALSWKYEMVQGIETRTKHRWPAIIEYFDSKQRLRTQLCQWVFGDNYPNNMMIIKQAITAIGFGARATMGGWQFVCETATGEKRYRPYTALTEIVHSRQHRQRLLEHHWFMEFVREQQKMDHMIYEEARKEPFSQRDIFKNARGKVIPSKVLSYMYQKNEFLLLTAMIDRIELDQPNNPVLLPCHDGIYVKYKPNIANLQALVSDTWREAHVGYEHIQAEQNTIEQDEFARAHKEHIHYEYAQADEILGRHIPRPRPLDLARGRKHNEEFDSGYDLGTQAYENPYLEDYV